MNKIITVGGGGQGMEVGVGVVPVCMPVTKT